jgi:hypothetical protein
MKRTMLIDQWRYLGEGDLSSLNVGAGTIEVLDLDTEENERHKLLPLYVQLIKYAYERGLAHKPLY